MTRTVANPVAHVCRVCGRPAQIDDLCGRHGGSVGVIIQMEGLSPYLRIGLRFLVSGSILMVILGVLTLLIGGSLTGREDSPGGSHLVGLVMIVVGLGILVLSMYVSQLRTWAWPAAIATSVVVAVVTIVLLAMTSPVGSYNTLVVACVVLPMAVAALLLAAWRVRAPEEATLPRDVAKAGGGGAGAAAPS
jgi:hypothetical protein